MATPIKRGDDNPQLQRQTWTNEWSRGNSYAEDWKGINPAKMQAKFNGLTFSAQRASMTVEKGVAELRVEWAADAAGGLGSGALELTVDRWECPEPRIEKHVFNHPYYIDGIYSFCTYSGKATTADNISTLLALVQKGASNKSPWSTFVASVAAFGSWSGFATANATLSAFMVRMYNLVLNDQTHYQDATYACRHTTNAPAYWTRNVADFAVNCILTPSQFMSEVTNGGLWYYPMPARLQYKLSAAASDLIASVPARSNYLIGWLKAPSGEATVGRGRIEISTSYALDQWSTDLYGTV